MEMVYVPAGEFQMGSTEKDLHAQSVHTVVLDDFWIDQTEVTNGQYRQCVAAGACDWPAENRSYTRNWYYGNSSYDNYPVVFVNWHQAMAYCEWMEARLPTEAEWEFAARGSEGRVYPWGDEFDGTRLNYCDANCGFVEADETADDGYTDTAPGGSYPDGASWCGALDMVGNVTEWVADWYWIYGPERQVNPTGPSFGDYRVQRGSSWGQGAGSAPSAKRMWGIPVLQNHFTGFRCARDAQVVDQVEEPTATPQPTDELRHAEVITWIRPADDTVMVRVPAGEFQAGSTKRYVDNEQPVHTVALDGYWIDQTEVTNGQYRLCVKAGACDPPAENGSFTRQQYYDNTIYDHHPVILVSWHQAAAYCEWAEMRLPTGAEWEYAARGPEGRMFPWGNEFDEKRLNYCDVSCQLAMFTGDVEGSGDTVPVRSYPDGISWCGALDMAGNVTEWVADWYGGYPSEWQANPTGPASGEQRVLRGGSWLLGSDAARGATRGKADPAEPYYDRGFRCAKDPD
jgi:formylglycine-generating enzyme required for sulfatase activity